MTLDFDGYFLNQMTYDNLIQFHNKELLLIPCLSPDLNRSRSL